MKKLLTIAIALIMALSLTAIPAFAAGELPTTIDYTEVHGVNPTDTVLDNVKIPVYGYVGADAKITDPVPGTGTDPTVKPEAVPYQVNVSVPTKIIWAAFESDGGAVTSPTYHIVNNSYTNNLTVTLVSFTKCYLGKATTDNDFVDPNLTLNITADGSPFTQSSVVAGNGTSAIYFGDSTANGTAIVGTLAKKVNTTTYPWNFKITGTYVGSYATAREPVYTMTLKFAVV
jgi:hypothetical protein